MAAARTFLRWCDRRDLGPQLDLDDEYAALRRSFPATYGKVQDRHRGRHLSDNECRRLLDVCSDQTWRGSRDQVAIRLGILGMRVSEACSLTWGDVDFESRTIAWTGKGRKPRSLRFGKSFAAMLKSWRTQTARHTTLTADTPVLCRMMHGNRSTDLGRLAWGEGLSPTVYRQLLTLRATAAGIGHVAPHDLRRTTANLLHSARTPEGAHHFDTADIQAVLGHARLDTTQRYLSLLNTDAIDRAAPVLDF